MILWRFKSNSKGVWGILKDDKGGTYFTAENPKTLIKEGVYLVMVNHSPKFKRNLPLLVNNDCPASRGIRIHVGNVPTVDSAGCILVGNSVDLAKNKLVSSKPALEQLLKNCGVHLEITSIIPG